MKLTEKQLYGVWLDLLYADQLNEEYIKEVLDDLKTKRKYRRKIKALLKKATEHYITINGKEPMKPKRW